MTTTRAIPASLSVRPMGKILRLDEVNADEATAAAVAALQAGELVIIPTDTVYGLAGDVTREAALRIFALKGRNYDKPLPVLVSGLAQLQQVARDVPPAVVVLAERYWPGPLTLILQKADRLPAEITAEHETVGVRVPDHVLALALLERHGRPIVATSANPSGAPAATSMDEVACDLIEAVAVALDAGPCPVQQASTVLDLTVSPPAILRPGPITQSELSDTLRTEVETAYNEHDAADRSQ